jgi:hypothetical protein
MEFTIQRVSFLVSEQVVRSSPDLLTSHLLPEEVLEHIFSFSGTYNVVNRAVCRDFRRIAPKVDPLLHLDHLLSCGEKIKIPTCTASMMQKAIHLQLLFVLDKYEEHVPVNLCEIAVCHGLVKVLRWTRSSSQKKEKYPWLNNVTNNDPEVLRWIRQQRPRYRFLQKIAWMEQW